MNDRDSKYIYERRPARDYVDHDGTAKKPLDWVSCVCTDCRWHGKHHGFSETSCVGGEDGKIHLDWGKDARGNKTCECNTYEQ